MPRRLKRHGSAGLKWILALAWAQGGSLVDQFRAITYVLRQEAAVSLGLAGRKLRLAMERLARFDAQGESRFPPTGESWCATRPTCCQPT